MRGDYDTQFINITWNGDGARHLRTLASAG